MAEASKSWNNTLKVYPEGLFCLPGNFYIDAWSPVEQCIITHAHSDHACGGHKHYIATPNTAHLLKLRLGSTYVIEELPYEKKVKIGHCWVSLHGAGHILGSAQVRIETNETVCVISGDYKRAPDPSCEPFSVQECEIFVTESTFGLPIYHWEAAEITVEKILDWWVENKECGFASVLFCYALGKAQRIMTLLKPHVKEPIYTHGALLTFMDYYKNQGISLASYLPVSEKQDYSKSLILAPPLAKGSAWMRRFLPYKTALASGWMQVRGIRKRKNLDQGFALSDHADWQSLLQTIQDSKASLVLTTHGNSATLARYLQETGIQAYPLLGTESIEEGEG